MKGVFVAVCAAAFILSETVHAETRYSVRVNPNQPRRAVVNAEVFPGDRGVCFIRAAGDTGLTHGWATFVHRLTVADSQGNSIRAAYDGNGCWSVETTESVSVQYTVLLQHDVFPNRPGDDELAYAGDWGQFWTGRALFIEGSADSSLDVDFELPAGWSVTAPWPAAENSGTGYVLSDFDSLFDSAFMLGTHKSHEFHHGDATLHIGLAGEGPRKRGDELVTLIQDGITSFSELHSAPPVGHFAVFLGESRRPGGGVMGQSISMVVPGDISDELMPLFTHMVTHEAFHLWNATLNYSAAPDMYWFSEGFAEYFTLRSLHQRGLLTTDSLLEAFARQGNLYLEAAGQLSLVGAGVEKLDNYNLIYSGGMMAALALDMHILESSDGHYRLDDILPSIVDRYGAGSEAGLNLVELVSLIEEQTHVDAEPVIARYVAGVEILPVEEIRRQFAETL